MAGVFQKTITRASLLVYGLFVPLLLFLLSFQVVNNFSILLMIGIFIAVSLFVECSSLFEEFREYRSTHSWVQLSSYGITFLTIGILFLAGGRQDFLVFMTGLYSLGCIEEIVKKRYTNKWISRCVKVCWVLFTIIYVQIY